MTNIVSQHSNNSDILDRFNRFEYNSINYRSKSATAIAKAADEYNKNCEPFDSIACIPVKALKIAAVDGIEFDFLIYYKRLTLGLTIIDTDNDKIVDNFSNECIEKYRKQIQVRERENAKDRLHNCMNIYRTFEYTDEYCIRFPDQVLRQILKRTDIFLEISYSPKSALRIYYNICASFLINDVGFSHKDLVSNETTIPNLNETLLLDFDGYTFVIARHGYDDIDFWNAEKMQEAGKQIYGIKFNFHFVNAQLSLLCHYNNNKILVSENESGWELTVVG